MTRWAHALCFAILVLNLYAHPQRARETPERRINPQSPLQVELLAPVDAGRISIGASVLAKARVDWNDPACHLRAGSVVVGHIIDLEKRSKLNKGSSLTIAFDHADCEGRKSPFQFTLFAIVAVPHVDEGIPLADTAARFGTTSAAPHFTGSASGPKSGPPPAVDYKDNMSGSGYTKTDKTPEVILAGQVVGIKKLTLSVGTGPDGASVLSSLNDNVRLEGATQLILMPRSSVSPTPAHTLTAEAEHPSTPSSEKSSPETSETVSAPIPPPAPPPEVDETSVCTDSCSLVPNLTTPSSTHAALTLSINSLGFIPHDSRERSAFDFESALIYLDAQNLLFTYDPHKLRQRLPSGFRTESMRTIRAVLLDPVTLTIKQIVDWQVQGDGQYIWRAGPAQILVHLGHHLRLLGPNLQPIRDIPVPGQLAFVSISPSGNHIAVGVLHERHPKEMHDFLLEATHLEPEEDIDIQLFDENLNLVFTARQNSSLPPPVLSDAGEIRVNSSGKDRWRIGEYRWDHTEHVIATMTSECRPSLATPLSNSVFLVGCSTSPARNWYRMLRLDGHAILTSHGSSQEIEQSSSSSTQDDFAVRVVRAHYARSRGERFHKQDLKEQEVSVYRTSDGKRLFITNEPGVSLAEQSFALSPAGNQLAILSDATLSLYPVIKPAQ
ncbi:hypothetical protein [Tunturiibacter lichenicola]|uniref:hypothetical protein n=1 Tax=Tunturiibacter lichenicola TaxID=2051959 RepID=UPI0021B17F0A|nr:hypothetical protein [Edaphobacter lichenicola]